MPCTNPEAVSISDRIRNGSSAGKTRVHQSFSPAREALNEDSGARTIAIASRIAAAPDRNGAEPRKNRRIVKLIISSITSS